MFRKDFVTNTLSGSLAAGATSLTLNDGSAFTSPAAATSVPYYFIGIFDASGPTTPEAAFISGDFETCLVTNRTTNTLTIERGFGRTSDVSHETDDTVVLLADAQNIAQTWAINVRSYGATGDDTTDDTTAVERAIVAGESLGLPVYFPPGKYEITSDAVNSTGDVCLFGAGRDSVIKSSLARANRLRDVQDGHEFCANGIQFVDWDIVANLNDLGVDDIVTSVIFKDCVFTDSNQIVSWASNKQSGAALNYGEVSGCEIIRPRKSIVDIIGNADRFVFRDNVVREANATSSTYLFKMGREVNSEQGDWKDISFTGNVFTNNAISSAANNHLVVIYGLKATIANNVIDGVTAAGLNAALLESRARYSTITGNVISSAGTSHVGILVGGDQRGESATVNQYGSVVSGNTLQLSNALVGIWITGDEVSVTGNYIEDATAGVIVGSNSGPVDHATISGNVLKRLSSSSTSGIQMLNIGIGTNVTGNTIDGYVTGISIDLGIRTTGSICTNISNNMITQFTSEGIRIDAGTNTGSLDRLVISNNNVYSLASATTALMTDGAATTGLTRLCISGNIFKAATLVNYIKTPSFTTFCQFMDEATPESNIVAEIGTIAVANPAGTASLHLKETGDHTNAGWKTVTIT